ncbi:MAG: radical SAM protein [Thermodesulfobacteriota bacterium]
MRKLLNRARKRLRGTIVHKVYAFLRYELRVLLLYRLVYNLRRGNWRKVTRYLAQRAHGVFREVPKGVAIDIVSCCNLRCPLCSVPPFITKQSGNFMGLEVFKRIVGGVSGATDLSLVYAGEPLLHPEFFEMVRWCASRFYTTTITNGTLLTEKNNRRLFESGLDFLQVSFDGFSKESFEKYRVGADFAKVKANIESLLRTRGASHRGLPHITITYLVNAFNEHETDACRRHFLGAGADRFFAKAINLNVHRRLDGKKEDDLREWLPRKTDISLYEDRGNGIGFKEKEGVCTICLTPIIRCDGEVLLCCHDIFNSVKIGNALTTPFEELWNGEEYRMLRALGRHRRLPVCRRCGK